MLGKREIKSRRCVLAMKLTTADGKESVIADPAVDLEKSNLKLYAESCFDMKHIVKKPGETLTYFTFRKLTAEQKGVRDSLEDRAEKIWNWRCSLINLENYEIYDEEDNKTLASAPVLADNGEFGKMVPEKYMKDLDLPLVILNLGSIMIDAMSEAQAPLSTRSDLPAGPSDSETKENTEE